MGCGLPCYGISSAIRYGIKYHEWSLNDEIIFDDEQSIGGMHDKNWKFEDAPEGWSYIFVDSIRE